MSDSADCEGSAVGLSKSNEEELCMVSVRVPWSVPVVRRNSNAVPRENVRVP